jgi:hypothetical protein
MENLKESFPSIALCKLGSKVISAIHFNIDRGVVYIEEDFQEGISYCKTFILDNILDLKQLILK